MSDKIEMEFYRKDCEIVWSPVNSRRVDHVKQFALLRVLYRRFPAYVSREELLENLDCRGKGSLQALVASAMACVGARFPYLIQYQRGCGYFLKPRTQRDDEYFGGGRKRSFIVRAHEHV